MRSQGRAREAKRDQYEVIEILDFGLKKLVRAGGKGGSATMYGIDQWRIFWEDLPSIPFLVCSC